MERDLRGFTGMLDQLTKRAASDVYGRGQVTSFETTPAGMEVDTSRTWWNGETEAVWMDGLLRMACLTGNDAARAKVDAYMRHILDTQTEEGYIGIYQPGCRYRHPKENGELWTQSRIFVAMLAYYEATGKPEVLQAVEKAVRLTMSQYGPGRSYFQNPEPAGGVGHGLMFVDVLEWLHRLTGDRAYVDFARFCYEDYNLSRKLRDKDNQLDHLLDIRAPFLWHTPHTMEHLRVPLWLYFVTGNPRIGQAARNGFTKTRRHLTPSGACIGDECIEGRKPDPNLPYEYCAMTELLISAQSALAKTGDSGFARMAENVALNAAQGARLPDGKAISYLTRDNRYRATHQGALGRFGYSPTHEQAAVCCNPNAGKLMPYYVSRMWMRQDEPEEGLVAVLYGPGSVTTRINGISVRIDEETHYPFSEEIRFTLHPEQEVAFPIIFRDPRWSRQTQTVAEGAAIQRDGDYCVVRKRWQAGDKVTLTFRAEIFPVRAINGETALRRGPLLYALPIPHERRTLRTYPVAGFADYDMLPIGDDGAATSQPGNDSAMQEAPPQWRYRLPSAGEQEDFGFVFHRDPDADMLHPWDRSPVRLDGLLTRGADQVRASLVPIGCTVLRRVTFPVLEQN